MTQEKIRKCSKALWVIFSIISVLTIIMAVLVPILLAAALVMLYVMGQDPEIMGTILSVLGPENTNVALSGGIAAVMGTTILMEAGFVLRAILYCWGKNLFKDMTNSGDPFLPGLGERIRKIAILALAANILSGRGDLLSWCVETLALVLISYMAEYGRELRQGTGNF